MNKIFDRFIYFKDRENPEKYLKGKYFLGSMFIFFSICVISIPYFLLALPQELKENPSMLIANFVFILITGSFFPIYKKWGGRIFLVNFITLFGFLGNYQTYVINGGIYSPDCIWGIILSSWVFLVADRISGYFWMISTIILYSIFFYADLNNYHDFLFDIKRFDSSYFFYNYLLGGIFMMLIISMYETTKQKFVNELRKSKSEIEEKSKELEAQKEDILSSINYAKRIQQAILPQEENIYRAIPLSFIMYKPKDIVSGDFFWFHEIDNDNCIIVCADCTGHGVPGAFMTVIGSSLLNQVIIENKTEEPAKILKELDSRITLTLKQQKDHYQIVQDGMDLSLVKINKSKKEFIFTSAKRPAIFIRNKEIKEFKGSKFTLGGLRSGEKVFNEIKMNYEPDDLIYLFTDGYIDQFGGPGHKKFMIKQFRELLLSINHLPMQQQKDKVENTITNWIGTNEQTDDILVMAIRF